ncbi:hypothetical protein [Humibacillus xanthopallidus]|uniref:hypothetical protein n=1 Tax=Humibacillus xanthopallidus TaxID=412689 RepID=UPI00384A9801
MTAMQQDPHGDSEQDPAEGFGGEATSVTPDGTPSSRWDRDAADEDALIGGVSGQPEQPGQPAQDDLIPDVPDIPPVEDARPNGDVAGL